MRETGRGKIEYDGRDYCAQVSETDSRRPAGLSSTSYYEVFGDYATVSVSMKCFDTLPETETPSVSPTLEPTDTPTGPPTPDCDMITISNVGSYTGDYIASSNINGHKSWIARHDAMTGELIKLYYYKGMLGDRWRLDGPNGSSTHIL